MLRRDANQDNWHKGYLDSLRGIAVLGVLIVHAGQASHLGFRLSSLSFVGQRGVQLFFIVSAFTLFMSNDNRREEGSPTRNFFLRRLFRIMPLYYIATAIACIFQSSTAGPKGDVVLSLLFLHGFTVDATRHGALGGWTIATEAIFYMCLPLFFLTIRSLSSALWVLLVSAPILFLISRFLYTQHPNTDYFCFYWFPVQFPIFTLGIVCYFIWKRYIAGSGPHPELSAALLVMAAIMICTNIPSTYRNMYLFSMGLAFLQLSLSLYSWRLLVNHFTMFMGKISYSVYLLHIYFLLAIAPHVQRMADHNPILKSEPWQQFFLIFAGTFALTIPTAFLTWRWIERPGIQLGRRLIERLEKPIPKPALHQLIP